MLGHLRMFNFNKKLSLENILKKEYKVPNRIVEFLLRLNTNTPVLGPGVTVTDPLDPEMWPVFCTMKSGIALHHHGGLDSPLKGNRPQHPGEYGLGQGSPLSPILAILSLDKWRALIPTTGWRILYADDGLFYHNNHDLPYPAPELRVVSNDLGVTINEKKSGMIKLNGKWLKPLKFLGSIFDPWEDTLNGIPISEITEKNLFKIVGKVYGPQPTPEEWDWSYKPKSLLYKIHSPSYVLTLLNWFRRPKWLLSGYKKWDYNLPIKEASTICSALLLHGLKSRPYIRRVYYGKRKTQFE